MWRADYMHCSAPFYIRNMSIHELWYPRWVLEPISRRYGGITIAFTKSLEVEVEVGNLGEIGAQISSSHKMSQEMLSVFERNKEVAK